MVSVGGENGHVYICNWLTGTSAALQDFSGQIVGVDYMDIKYTEKTAQIYDDKKIIIDLPSAGTVITALDYWKGQYLISADLFEESQSTSITKISYAQNFYAVERSDTTLYLIGKINTALYYPFHDGSTSKNFSKGTIMSPGFMINRDWKNNNVSFKAWWKENW